MERLNLPIIKGVLPYARHLSMEDYLKFVNLHLKYTLDKKAIKKQKKLAARLVEKKGDGEGERKL
jgi:hypothetical protein